MRNLLNKLLHSDTEVQVKRVLAEAGLWDKPEYWRWLGDSPNNQSVVHAQQSNAAAALIEKITNSIDAILVKRCRELGIDPRGAAAPSSMDQAIAEFIGVDLDDFVAFAEANLLLIGTGDKDRLTLSIYDNGEGQSADEFPDTFCSLIHGHGTGASNKGGIPFVQGRFNMGATGILPYLGDNHHMQLIVSRRPASLVGNDEQAWAFTVFRFEQDPSSPGWKYLIKADREVYTAGREPLKLIPTAGKSAVLSDPYGREVASGTLIKMYEYRGAKANICGDPLHPKLERFLLQPRLPIRLVECRPSRKANVMRTTVWDTLGRWGQKEKALEPEFKDGASFSLKLETGEDVPGEIRVFKSEYGRKQGRPSHADADKPLAGLRALINGQVHAAREPALFRSKDVGYEHIAGSMLVTLDCTGLSPASRGRLFMANRENFREDSLLDDLLRRLKAELRGHEGLKSLNERRYDEKLATATKDEAGLKTLEDLLINDPSLAALFGGLVAGKVAAPLDKPGSGDKIPGSPMPFVGQEYPSFFRPVGATMKVDVPFGSTRRPTWYTDVKNTYLTRNRHRGRIEIVSDPSGLIESQGSLHSGRFSVTLKYPRGKLHGSPYNVELRITDDHGSGPFSLRVEGNLVAALKKKKKRTRKRRRTAPEPKLFSTPSSLNVRDVDDRDPADPPLAIMNDPKTTNLVLLYNTKCALLVEARSLRPTAQGKAVDFVFKWGLALACIGMIDAKKRADQWDGGNAKEEIQNAIAALARVIVPLCLTLPSKLSEV